MEKGENCYLWKFVCGGGEEISRAAGREGSKEGFCYTVYFFLKEETNKEEEVTTLAT